MSVHNECQHDLSDLGPTLVGHYKCRCGYQTAHPERAHVVAYAALKRHALALEQRVAALEAALTRVSGECAKGKGWLERCESCGRWFRAGSDEGWYLWKETASEDDPRRVAFCLSCWKDHAEDDAYSAHVEALTMAGWLLQTRLIGDIGVLQAAIRYLGITGAEFAKVVKQAAP